MGGDSLMRGLDAWEAWRGAARGMYSPDTLRQYLPAVLRFLALAGLASTPVEAIAPSHILAFYGEFCPTGSAKTQMHRALSAWFVFLDAEGVLFRNPTSSIKLRRPREPKPTALTPDELGRLLDALEALRGRRAALCVLLAYLLGLRRKEATALRWTDILDTEGGPVMRLTITKGDDPRDVPLSPDAVAVLAEIRASPTRYVRKEQRDHIVGVSKGTFSEWVDQAGTAAGLAAQKTHSHILRASFATHLLRRGVNARIVQELLGHAKLTTTQRYLEVTTDEMHRAVAVLPKFTIEVGERPGAQFVRVPAPMDVSLPGDPGRAPHIRHTLLPELEGS